MLLVITVPIWHNNDENDKDVDDDGCDN
jgi:hypothetical protein